MRYLRVRGGAILSAVFGLLAAFAPLSWAAPTKQFTIDVTSPASVMLGATNVSSTVVLTNETPNGNSSINAVFLYVPLGLTVVGTPTVTKTNDTAYPVGTITVAAGAGVNGSTKVTIPNLFPVKPKESIKIKLVLNVDSTASCGALNWFAEGWTGSNFGGEDKFTFLDTATMGAAPFNRTVNQATTVNGPATLAITSPPEGSSAFIGVPKSVTVALTNACLTNLSGISVTLAKTSGSAGGFTSALATTDATGVATFSVTFSSAGTAKLVASATNSTSYPTSEVNLKVFDDTLAQGECESSTYDALTLLDEDYVPQFQSDVGGSSIGTTGFVAGTRGPGDGKLVAGCSEVDFSLVNNIPTLVGNPNLIDPQGNTVKPGYFSFTFDTTDGIVPVVGLVTTYRPEWGALDTGLPTLQTKICTNAGCTTTKVLPACKSSLVLHTSLPSGENACLAAERWNVVAPAACGTEPTNPPAGWIKRCLQFTSVIIAGEDPVFGR